MKMSTITIRVDKNIKEQAEQIFENIGLNTTTAFTLFMKSVIREGEIPFKLKIDPFFGASNLDFLSPGSHTTLSVESTTTGHISLFFI